MKNILVWLKLRRRVPPLFPTKTPQPRLSRHTRRAFLTFCTALLLESIVLQLATTADGSEVAFNPDPSMITSTISYSGSKKVASASVERSTDEPVQEQPQAEPAVATSPSLITHAQAAAPPQPLSEPVLRFHVPLREYQITQYYSYYHTAIDMAAVWGTPVFATTEGVVAETGYLLPGGGLMVKVNHDGGYSSYYAHLSAITTSAGQQVNNSSQIGRVGATGWATGPHLHFMIWKDQQALNPLNLLQ